MEMYILEESSGYIFSNSQLGFVSGRGTEIATALVNDVISYANVRGSTVYTCSLDAEGAFQGRPQDLAGGGAKNFFFQIWKFACREATCCAWRSHALY